MVRIAKKMDKMVQKKNAVSGGRAGGRAGPGQAETATPAHAEPVGPRRAAPRAPPACTAVLATSAGSPGRDPPRLRDVRPRRLPPNGCLGAAVRLRE